MRVSSSQHTFDVGLFRDRTTGKVLPDPVESGVDFTRLARRLRVAPVLGDSQNPDTELQATSNAVDKGKGRADLEQPSTKRIKTEEEQDVDESRNIPVLFHTFDICLQVPADCEIRRSRERDQKNFDILQVLTERFLNIDDLRSSQTFDLGPVHCGDRECTSAWEKDEDDKRLELEWETAEDDPWEMERKALLFMDFGGGVLFHLPSDKILSSTSDADLDLRIDSLKSLLVAAHILERTGRASTTYRLHAIARSPSQELEEGQILPIALRLEARLSLNVPGVFQPVVLGNIRDREEEEAQRRILTYVFGELAVPNNYHGSSDMHFFLSSLKPAPELPFEIASDTVQHPELHPTLLPFQRRSVAWLLGQEHKRINRFGQLYSSGSSELPLFWEELRPDDSERWYYNRLTGDLLPSFPPVDSFVGGMLAEEPGLGKTLESIALILLNPANDRQPTERHWDPVSKVNMGEVRTTLIVTPPSLAQQWADELTLHTPSLKVYVYDGWTKVPPSVKRAEAEKQRLREEEKKNEKLRDKQRRLGKKRQYEEVDEMPEEAVAVRQTTQDGELEDWCSYINRYDVCITTYTTLRSDLAVARPPITRPRREVGNYTNIQHSRSPLILCEWYRVIMDEVQMAGGDKIEEMVSLIPRVSSLAVSGTPARATVDDLKHVLTFLGVKAAIEYSKHWNRLQLRGFAALFKQLFERVGVRTLKAKVQNELTIPQQKRYVVPIELGRVERHVYSQNLEQALLELGLDSRGVAASEDWELDVIALRSWMKRLRGICTHPQVGQLQRANDKLSAKAAGSLKTIGEVLENMKNENWTQLMTDRRAKVQAVVQVARLMQHNTADNQRHKNSLELLLKARGDMNLLHDDLKAALADLEAKGQMLKQEAIAARRAARVSSPEAPSSTTPDLSANAKGKQRADPQEDSDPLDVMDAEEDQGDGDDELPKTAAGEEYKHRHQAIVGRIRECVIMLHQIHFLLGDIYHTLGPSYEQQENEAYEEAENIRKRYLKSSEQAAKWSMEDLKRNAIDLKKQEERLIIEHLGEGTDVSDELLREADGIIDMLNAQAGLLCEWRKRIFELLTKSLTASEDGDADGEEYNRSLEVQGEAETYLQACAALFADRREALILERTALAAYDARERKIRHTVAAQKAAAGLEDIDPVLLGELQPEQEVLKLELTTQRKALLKMYDGRAIKNIMVDLSALANTMREYDEDGREIENEEKTAISNWSLHLRRVISEQSKLHTRLEEDMAKARTTFNIRIKYFAQLQELSDTVMEVTWEGRIADSLKAAKDDDLRLELEINKHRARQRYLENLVSDHVDGAMDEEDDCCILCKCEFIRGFVTQCAHVFCEDCLKAWFARREGKSCPVCRMIIDPENLRRVTLREKKIEKPQSTHPASKDPAPLSRRVIEYNKMNPDVFSEIQKVESHGDYGSKVETIVKHLLYLQDKDPGAKSIIFSAWQDSLHILQHALTANGISSLRIDQASGKKSAAKRFKSDPGILVLLLHGERENAGLNVTCASRVFLVESVVQHAFEIQAIARIDRMGQTRPTEVYCYYAEGTVEKNILDLAAKKGMSLYTKGNESGTLKMTTLDLDEDKKVDGPAVKKQQKQQQKGDFIYKADDMLAILFPHMFEDLEYLLPNDEDTDMEHTGTLAGDRPRDMDFIDSVDTHSQVLSPVAGPSRLR